MTRRLLYLFAILMVSCLSSLAQQIDNTLDTTTTQDSVANTPIATEWNEESIAGLYADSKYNEVSSAYEELLLNESNQENPAYYYNLGNAYYQSGKVAEAILAFERALRLSPNDADIKHNLKLARLKVIDPIDTQAPFMQESLKTMAYLMPIGLLSMLTILSFTLVVSGLLAFILSRTHWIRRLGFYMSGFALIFSLLFWSLAAYQRHQYESTRLHIVMESQLNLKESSTDSSNTLLVLHAGTRVHVTGDKQNGFVAVLLDDERAGWVHMQGIEAVNKSESTNVNK